MISNTEKQKHPNKTTTDEVTFEDYQECLEYLFRPHCFFLFPEVFLDFMSRHDAVTLAYLIGHSRRSGKERGWYYCKMSLMMKELRISSSSQTRDIAALVYHDFIETKQVKNVRYIRIKWTTIVPLMKQHMSNRPQWESEG